MQMFISIYFFRKEKLPQFRFIDMNSIILIHNQCKINLSHLRFHQMHTILRVSYIELIIIYVIC
jgi:hypothetical protein